MLAADILILCYGQAQTVLLPYDFLLVSVLGKDSIWSFDQKPCRACSEKLSTFFVLRSTGDAVMSPCRSSIALKKEKSMNSSQTSVRPSQEGHNTSAPVRSHESGGSSISTVSNGLRSVLALTWKMEVPILITTMAPLTAMISTFNHSPDFRPCCILLRSSCQ